jgi:hypothetical protein
MGRIVYADNTTGVLILLKPAVTANSSRIVRDFDQSNIAFPHEPTANQWFDEAQFEAYRLLGKETVGELLDAIRSADIDATGTGMTDLHWLTDILTPASPLPSQSFSSDLRETQHV